MAKNKKITFFDTTIHPGEVANLALPLPELYSCSPMYMPIKVMHGEKEGPCLVIFSMTKGTELNGLEITNRTIEILSKSKIQGTVIAIPVLNVYGLTHSTDTLPSGSQLINCFPGDEHGSYGQRLAWMITEEVLKKADVCIELQTGGLNHNILPQVYCNFDNPRAKELAKSFMTPVITQVNIENNSLRRTTEEELQVPLLVYQAGEAQRFDPAAIRLGIDGVRNVMRHLGMFEHEELLISKPIFSRDEEWTLAHKGGIFQPEITLGQTIHEGDIIGTISDPFGADILESIKASYTGVVVGINTSPLVYEGMRILKIASFLDTEKAEAAIERWDEKQEGSYLNPHA